MGLVIIITAPVYQTVSAAAAHTPATEHIINMAAATVANIQIVLVHRLHRVMGMAVRAVMAAPLTGRAIVLATALASATMALSAHPVHHRRTIADR